MNLAYICCIRFLFEAKQTGIVKLPDVKVVHVVVLFPMLLMVLIWINIDYGMDKQLHYCFVWDVIIHPWPN